LVPTHQGPVRSCGHQIAKTQIHQRSPQPAQASPLGHFRHPGCLQRFRSFFRSLENSFARAVWKEQVAESYFELLRLPMDMQGLKPSILMGKLKQHLPPGVSLDTDLFMAMFLIRLPPSMREAVGTGIHKTAADTVRAADALWDARGGHDPTVAAATTNRSRSPAPTSGKMTDKRNGNACSKSRLPSRPAFHAYQNPANGVCKFHNYYSNRAHRCIAPCTFSEN
jgi:hypothetical protein